MVEKVDQAVGGAAGKTIGVLGLAFKPETDDMRDSPSLPLIEGLQSLGATVRAYDPQAMDAARGMFKNLTFCDDAYSTAQGCDAIVLCTEWNEFRALNLERLKQALKKPVLVDLRNIYDPARVRAAGFEYTSVGRAAEVRLREEARS